MTFPEQIILNLYRRQLGDCVLHRSGIRMKNGASVLLQRALCVDGRGFHCQFHIVSTLSPVEIGSGVLVEDQLMLFMFYLEKRKIVACNMLAKLVDFS